MQPRADAIFSTMISTAGDVTSLKVSPRVSG